MRRASRTLTLLIAAAIAGCAPMDFEYADGTRGDYSDWRGHWVFVNYWAKWCAPCRHEIPELNAFGAATAALVVGVNFDGVDGDALRTLIRQMGIEFRVTTKDPRAHFGYDLPSVLPSTVVIDPRGAVRATLVGPQTQSSLQAAMQQGIPE